MGDNPTLLNLLKKYWEKIIDQGKYWHNQLKRAFRWMRWTPNNAIYSDSLTLNFIAKYGRWKWKKES